jgi:hypothetical protein
MNYRLSHLARPAYRPPVKSKAVGQFAVRGKSASSYEYFFSLALDKFELTYLFQVSYWGGRTMRGGIVLDFLVFTQPLATPVWINGEYWHRAGRAQEDFLQQILLDVFSQGQLAPAKTYWGKDVEDFEAAVSTVRKDFAV